MALQDGKFPLTHWAKRPDHLKTDEQLESTPCFAALDLSSRVDLSALSLCFPSKKDGEDVYDFRTFYYVPESKAATKLWTGENITVFPGETISHRLVLESIKKTLGQYDVEFLAYDPWNTRYLADELSDLVRCREFPQTTQNFNQAIKEFEAATIEGRIAFPLDDTTTLECVCNLAYTFDDMDNVRPSKMKSGGSITGIVAAFMAFALANRYGR